MFFHHYSINGKWQCAASILAGEGRILGSPLGLSMLMGILVSRIFSIDAKVGNALFKSEGLDPPLGFLWLCLRWKEGYRETLLLSGVNISPGYPWGFWYPKISPFFSSPRPWKPPFNSLYLWVQLFFFRFHDTMISQIEIDTMKSILFHRYYEFI